MSARHHSPYNRQNLSLKLVHHYVVICNAASLSTAAHQLNVCQSNLTLQMNELEEKLGAKLLLRSWRGIELTDAGRYFLTEAKSILRRFERIREELQRIVNGSQSPVVCGTFDAIDYAAVPKSIKRLRASDPELEVKVVEMSTSSQPHALETDQIHVAVMLGRLPNLRFRTETLEATSLELLVPSDHRLARKRGSSVVSELSGETFWLVEREAEPALHRKSTEFFEKLGVPRTRVRHATSFKDTIAQVSSGGGLALMPACLWLESGRDVIRKRLGGLAPALEVILCHKGSKGSSSSQAVAKGLVETAQGFRSLGPTVLNIHGE